MAKQKTEEHVSLSRSEKVNLKLFSRGRAAYSSVRDLTKASGLSKKKAVQFSHAKTSYTKFGPLNRRFQRLQDFKYLLVAVDVVFL